MLKIKIYLDDNIDSNLIKGILRANGFDVISPREIGMMGTSYDNHLMCAVSNRAIVLTQDIRFPNLGPHIKHNGILIIYRSNNIKKDMTPTKILKALKNIQKRNLNLENQTLPLNNFL